jgi:hypothetical protein
MNSPQGLGRSQLNLMIFIFKAENQTFGGTFIADLPERQCRFSSHTFTAKTVVI